MTEPTHRLLVNVASSYEVLEGFINLDNHPFLRLLPVYPIATRLLPTKYRADLKKLYDARRRYGLVRHDCRSPLPFPPNSIDHILCSHFLEHLYSEEAKRVLANFYDMLKPGGTIDIIVPDLEPQARAYFESLGEGQAADRLLTETLIGRPYRPSMKHQLLELLGGFGLQHRWMYDHASMSARILEAGFQIERAGQSENPSAAFRASTTADGAVRAFARKPIGANARIA